MAFLPGATNFWRRIVFHPCARPFYVYAVAFTFAWVEAWVTVRFIDMEDILRDRARERARKGARASRRSMRHTRKPIMQAAQKANQRFATKALRTALWFTQPIENIGLKILLIGAADQFFYRFTSLLEAADFCETPINSGPLQRSRGPGQQSILPTGGAINLSSLDQNRGGWSTNQFSAGVPTGFYNIILAQTVRAGSGGANGVRLKLTALGNAGPSEILGEAQDLGPHEQADLTLFAEPFFILPSGGSLSWSLVGPAIPIGIRTEGARIAVQRQG